MSFPYKSVFVAGHRGMVGSAVTRNLKDIPDLQIITRSRQELNLEDSLAVLDFFEESKPEAVVFAAARVGGIHANNSYPVEFMLENLKTQLSTIEAAFKTGVKRFLFLGSTCVYPRLARQPIQESELLQGPLEPTNEAYGLAKICGIKLCDYYRRQYKRQFHSIMPTNLYGPGDNYDLDSSHVVPALINKIHEAKINRSPSVEIWGTGSPKREFLHVDDLARAVRVSLCIDNPPELMNVGYGKDISIMELTRKICKVVGYKGEITTNTSKPDGMPRKLTDISLIKSYGWEPTINLELGLTHAYSHFRHGGRK